MANCIDCECETEELCDNRVPAYYVGRNGMYAKDVVWEFDLSYNLGTAVTYLLRAKRKHRTPKDCIKKAIAHLEFELNNIENESKKCKKK